MSLDQLHELEIENSEIPMSLEAMSFISHWVC